jgi:UPF0755 protein
MKNRFTLIVILSLLCVVFWGGYKVQQFARYPLELTQETLFTVPAGTSRVALAGLLTDSHLVTDISWFSWLLRIEPQLAKFKAGTYRVVPGMTVRELLTLLVSGREAQFPIRFIEGTVLGDWLVVLRQAPYLQHQLTDKNDQDIAHLLGMQEGLHPQGWFYPDTYYYTAGTSDLVLLQRAHEKMKKVVNEIWQGRAEQLPYKTPDELLTMASIIEKETALDDERAKIASVFVNRLHKGMRLQTDPTVIYGLNDSYNGTLSKSDLVKVTLYNTYIINGLPPGPIAMPGLASLTAAAHPAATPWLYFVADGKGGHSFSADLASHNKAVNSWRQMLKASDEK